jgi:predicted short-subunit dehydrogenase-like oxidoreductase (DUF2520 family)
MNIVIIGTGNVAHVLGRKIIQCGHNVIQVAGRNAANTNTLGALLHAEAVSAFSDIVTDADLYIIAVSDAALADVESWLPVKGNGIMVHTAGSVSKGVLKKTARRYGVLYPLQSLRSSSVVIPEIPFLIDADSPDTLQSIQQFASSLSGRVQYADDETRLKLHAAAVIVNNFTNYLYTLTQDLCTKEALDFSLLLPLLQETVSRIGRYPARLMQTGPALRNDQVTMDKHLFVLEPYPELLKIYQTLSDSIKSYYRSDI